MKTGRMDRVKAALRSHAELCAMSDLYGSGLANGRNDVSTLRSRGWLIDTTYDDHGAGSHKHYRLIDEPAAEQLSFQRRMRLVEMLPNRMKGKA